MIIFYKGDYQNDNNELYIFHETNGLGCFIYRYHLYFSPLVHPDPHQSCANHFNESSSVYQSLYTVVERSSYKLYPLSSLRNLRASGILRLLRRNRKTRRSYRRISGRILMRRCRRRIMIKLCLNCWSEKLNSTFKRRIKNVELSSTEVYTEHKYSVRKGFK